tara:strand:- start:3573 stop:3746 length:174 start_codon:yes stop_codon:yes gene_type:complete
LTHTTLISAAFFIGKNKMQSNKRKALIAAYEIKRRKTSEGKRKAILKWCRVMKEVLS